MSLRSIAAMVGGGLILSFTGVPAQASAQAASPNCTIHLYPAAKLRSVGEDFDAVKRVDQDLRAYEAIAGRPLNWLLPQRQVELARQVPLGAFAALGDAAIVGHAALNRQQALASGPREDGDDCRLEVATPQIMLERGGLAERSLRLFGVVRLFRGGQQVRSFSGFAAAPMSRFRLKSPEDLAAMTDLVETAYRTAIGQLVQAASK